MKGGAVGVETETPKASRSEVPKAGVEWEGNGEGSIRFPSRQVGLGERLKLPQPVPGFGAF